MKKNFNIFILILIFVAIGLCRQTFLAENNPQIGFVADFFDVGQGDAAYFRGDDGFEVLIDGGPDKTILTQLGKTMNRNDNEINVVVLTHPHADHLTGLIAVLEKYKIDEIIMTDAFQNSEGYLQWMKLIAAKNVPVVYPLSGENFSWGSSMNFQVLYPDRSFKDAKIDNLNLTSIVGIVRHKDESFLMTGDAENSIQEEILISNRPIRATVYKFPHHGSSNGLDENFIKAVNPQYVVIFAGKNNKFNHPNRDSLEYLINYKIKYFCTKDNGSIKFFYKNNNFIYYLEKQT